MRAWCIICALGIAVVSYLPVLPSVLICLPILLLAIVCARRPQVKYITPFMLGVFWGVAYGYVTESTWLPSEYEGQNLLVTGVVTGLPTISEKGVRFDFLIDTIKPLSLSKHSKSSWSTEQFNSLALQKIVLSWFDQFQLEPGDAWQFEVRLKRPRGQVNPHGFDYQAWLMRNGIDATGYVRTSAFNQELAKTSLHFDVVVSRLRYQMKQRLEGLLADRPERSLIQALVVGDKQGISQERWQLLRDTGIIHLVVISGLHVGLMATLSYLLVRVALPFFPAAIRYFSAQQYAAFAAIAAAFSYALFAGFALPTQRAFIMVAVAMLGQLLTRTIPLDSGFCIALVLVMLLDPLACHSHGFWLSFMAVFVLIYGLTHRIKIRGSSRWFNMDWLRAQWLVFIALIPPLMYLVYGFSLLSPVANMIAIPLVSLLVVPLALLGVAVSIFNDIVAEFLLHMAESIMHFLLQLLEEIQVVFANHAIDSTWSINAEISLVAVITACLGGLLLLAPRGIPVRWCGIFLFAPLLLPNNQVIPHGEFKLTVLDVGQGLAVVIESASHVLVYDTGPSYGPNSDAGDRVVMPYLSGRGIHVIDMLIVSHGDDDHAGGVDSIVSGAKPRKIMSGEPARLKEDYPTVSIADCHQRYDWQWDGITFEFLGIDNKSYKTANDQSCVLRISNAKFTVLLPGDIGKQVERDLLRLGIAKLGANVVLAPHHGSKSSSSWRFIQAISPDTVIYSSGYNNSFNHPNANVMQRYQRQGAKSYNTAETGAVTVYSQFEGKVGVVVGQRDIDNRYWYRI